ncbi:MAG: TetR/AcrR family transcriptional regulator [Xanthobacteraceae bacterium]|jgi:AcrR family transcriptional regulator
MPRSSPAQARRPANENAVRRRQAERTEATRAALIRATIDVICERGYAATTAAAIVHRAEVTRGALQHHFGSIQELYLEVVAFVSRELVGEIEAEIATRDTLDQRVSAVAARYWHVYSGDDYVALLEIWIGSRNDAALRPRIDRLMRAITDKRSEYWNVMLSAMQLPRAELDILRATLLSTVRGAAIHRLFSRDDKRGLRQVEFILELVSLWIEKRRTARAGRTGKRSDGTR